MNKPKIHVIMGSIRNGRSGEKVTKWFMDAVKDQDVAELKLVDLKDYPLPLFADATPPSVREGIHPLPEAQKWLDVIDEADGYIFITAEYNHSVPGAFKNAIDYGFKEWNDKSIGFVGYGNPAGGSRAVEHLRQIASELRMHDIREQVVIPTVWEAFDQQDNLVNSESLAKTANLILQKVAKLAIQLKS